MLNLKQSLHNVQSLFSSPYNGIAPKKWHATEILPPSGRFRDVPKFETFPVLNDIAKNNTSLYNRNYQQNLYRSNYWQTKYDNPKVSQTKNTNLIFTNRSFGENKSTGVSSDRNTEKRLNSANEGISNVHTPNDDEQKKQGSKRKQRKPQKSPESSDPKFSGVTFSMTPKIENFKTNLQFHFKYSLNKRIRRKFRLQSCDDAREDSVEAESDCKLSTSSESEDNSCTINQSHIGDYIVEKECASCGTRTTPLWRDAHNIPLCNACGIRYRKYNMRCVRCWYVPKKTGKVPSKCRFCGSSVRSSHYRKM